MNGGMRRDKLNEEKMIRWITEILDGENEPLA
jgi:hypothetical protein